METTGRRRRLPLPLFILGAILLLLLCVLLIIILYPIIFPPPAGLTANADGPYMVGEAQPLTLDGSGSKGAITAYAWDFGDGTTGSGAKPVHTYPDGPKQFTVTLTVTDAQGRTARDATQVTVNNLPPTADAGGPYTCQVNETIQLNGTCDDPSPVDAATLKCTWADFSGAALTQPSYICPTTPGTRTVTLTATDKDGASAQSSALVTVVQVRLMADADGPYSGTVGSPVTVDGSGSSPADRITSYQWSFGDGQTGAGAVISHTYAASGTYTLVLTVSDGVTQATDTATATIRAAEGGNQPPQAVITLQAIPKTSNRCYRFTGSASKDPDGQIVSYAWDLGDQNTRTGPEVEYCYAKAGTYHVTLTVTDNGGATGSATSTVVVP
jgi:PKD repeat protein